MFDEQPDTPGPEIPDASNASPELRRAFWIIVLVLNVGLFALAIGLLLVLFRGWTTPGPTLVLFGIAFLTTAYYRYRKTKTTILAEEGS